MTDKKNKRKCRKLRVVNITKTKEGLVWCRPFGGEVEIENRNSEFMDAATAAVKSGNWMVRADDGGESHEWQFHWEPQGEWTEAPDWDSTPVCGGGLHGVTQEASGHMAGSRVVFCETEGPRVVVDGDHIKVPRARILLIAELPNGLRFDGDLGIHGSYRLRRLGTNMFVGGDFELQGNSELTHLPVNLHVGGNFYLQEYGIKRLPKGLRVDGHLNLDFTGIMSLPDNLYVGADLGLMSTKITRLPDGLHVGGDLSIGFTDVRRLPPDLYVGGFIDIRNTNITSIPDALQVGGRIYTGNKYRIVKDRQGRVHECRLDDKVGADSVPRTFFSGLFKGR